MKIVNKLFLTGAIAVAALSAIMLSPTVSSAQDESAPFDSSSVPATGAKAGDFVPKGWKIEEQVKGDVNADGVTDVLIKLIEDKPKKEDEFVDRNRVLVIAVADGKGGWRNAAVADKLLQCTGCGGAFYGVMDAPATVSIEKGVIVVSQDHGSREVTETTFRFRYDGQPDMFILIGFDYATRDRATGGVWTESTNYITGKRVTTIGKGKKTTTKTTAVTKDRKSIEQVDSDQFEEAATKRLGLD